ncbi:MAG: YceI family protein [Gemmatimonadaceae bacterium]|nr:YceI family protein [Gemmatimonadaceae bacterium]
MSTTIEPIAANAIPTWQIDPAHTNVEFAVKHLMIATVKGGFADVTGVLKGDLAQPGQFELEVDLATASVDTRQEQRDAHLRSADFFDAEKWPTIRFVGKRIDGDVGADFTLYGDITIRSVTRELKLDVTNEGTARDPWGNSRVGFSAKGKLDRRDFGLVYNQALETGGFVLGDEIKLSIDAEFTAVAVDAAAA